MPRIDSAETSCGAVWLLSGQIRGTDAVRDIPITRLPFRMGRRADLDLVLDVPAVSSVHAEIVVQSRAKLAIRDLGSTNGTFVNGLRVAQTRVLEDGDWVQLANVRLRLHRENAIVGATTDAPQICDAAIELLQFDHLWDHKAVIPFFQPIVALRDRCTMGFESLARSGISGLRTPDAMFRVATQLNLECKLSQLCRRASMEHRQSIPETRNLFLNTHPSEMQDMPELCQSLHSLRATYPHQILTLELHEKAVADTKVVHELRTCLNELNIMLAYDDFGAGQTRLVQLAEVPPDFLKFDVSFIRAIDAAPQRRHDLLAKLVAMVHDLGIVPLAEGVETEAEAEACHQLGFELGQGFFYGRPVAARDLAAANG